MSEEPKTWQAEIRAEGPNQWRLAILDPSGEVLAQAIVSDLAELLEAAEVGRRALAASAQDPVALSDEVVVKLGRPH